MVKIETTDVVNLLALGQHKVDREADHFVNMDFMVPLLDRLDNLSGLMQIRSFSSRIKKTAEKKFKEYIEVVPETDLKDEIFLYAVDVDVSFYVAYIDKVRYGLLYHNTVPVFCYRMEEIEDSYKFNCFNTFGLSNEGMQEAASVMWAVFCITELNDETKAYKVGPNSKFRIPGLGKAINKSLFELKFYHNSTLGVPVVERLKSGK